MAQSKELIEFFSRYNQMIPTVTQEDPNDGSPEVSPVEWALDMLFLFLIVIIIINSY